MRKILDKMFENKKLSILIPILTSVLLYLLFVIFGTSEDKINDIIRTPIVGILWFFGSFFVIYLQVRNPSCPEWFLNFAELFATVAFCAFSLIYAISSIVNGFQNFSTGVCVGFITYASVAWAHSKRKK